MSEVIRFQPAKALRHSRPDESGAQILFFTGVRYQRIIEDARAPARQASTVARREGKGGDGARRR